MRGSPSLPMPPLISLVHSANVSRVSVFPLTSGCLCLSPFCHENPQTSLHLAPQC